MIQVNNRGPVSMASRFKPVALRGLGALQYEKEGTSYVANDVATMGVFKQLQRMNNAAYEFFASTPGEPLILAQVAVDGKLGPKTFAAVAAQLKAHPVQYGVASVPVAPPDLATMVKNVQGYTTYLQMVSGVQLPSASAIVLSDDYQGSSYAPGGTPATPPKPGITVTDLNVAKKSGATVYVAGGLLALGAILLLGKFGSKVPKRKGFRGCRGMACRGY